MAGRKRIGREGLLDVAASLFHAATFEKVAGFIGPRPVATAAGVKPGTVTYHFPSDRGEALAYQALKRALDRVGNALVDEAADALEAAADRLQQGDPNAVDEIAAALTQDMRVFSPDDGPSDPIVESEEVALFLAASVAPHDPAAERLARDFCRPMRKTYERTNQKLLEATGRRWRSGIDGESFAVITGALCDGWVWLRRFDRDAAPLDLFADTWMRLFAACSEPATAVPGSHFADGFVPPPMPDLLDRQQHSDIARAAAEVYAQVGWAGLTLGAVAEVAQISRHVVIAHFHDRRGLAAAVWARHVPSLTGEAERDTRLSLVAAVEANLTRFADLARRDPQLTAAFLDGVFSYTVAHGAPKHADAADPRNLVPLPNLLVPIIRANTSQFRPGNAENPRRIFDSAALLTNNCLHLAMTRPTLKPSDVADRICDTTLAGMLKRRPGPGRRKR